MTNVTPCPIGAALNASTPTSPLRALPILVVEDDADLREAIADTLLLAGYTVVVAEDGTRALALLLRQSVAMVVSDVAMQPMDGNQLLREIKLRYPYLPVLLMTAYSEVNHAVASIQAGACHYLPKPFEPDALVAQVTRYALSRLPGDDDVISADPAMQSVLQLAKRVANSDAAVLIAGETGTGKEVLARYLHRHSTRANGPFVAINCAAIPETLLEATLFGVEKGAFTGAATASAGKFEQAQHGTLLLDEISEMPLGLQVKLLRVLQERQVERVGGHKTIALDFRLLASTNRNLAEWVAQGKFREDLYYRINVFPLTLPPLRVRPADIVPLANYLMQRYAKPAAPILTVAAQAALTRYPWPGNVRELENVVQRALILGQGGQIDVKDLMLPTAAVSGEPEPEIPRAAASDAFPDVARGGVKDLERQHILDALARAGGVRKQAAQLLNMSERTLRYKLAQYREGGWEEGESL